MNVTVDPLIVPLGVSLSAKVPVSTVASENVCVLVEYDTTPLGKVAHPPVADAVVIKA